MSAYLFAFMDGNSNAGQRINVNNTVGVATDVNTLEQNTSPFVSRTQKTVDKIVRDGVWFTNANESDADSRESLANLISNMHKSDDANSRAQEDASAMAIANFGRHVYFLADFFKVPIGAEDIAYLAKAYHERKSNELARYVDIHSTDNNANYAKLSFSYGPFELRGEYSHTGLKFYVMLRDHETDVSSFNIIEFGDCANLTLTDKDGRNIISKVCLPFSNAVFAPNQIQFKDYEARLHIAKPQHRQMSEPMPDEMMAQSYLHTVPELQPDNLFRLLAERKQQATENIEPNLDELVKQYHIDLDLGPVCKALYECQSNDASGYDKRLGCAELSTESNLLRIVTHDKYVLMQPSFIEPNTRAAGHNSLFNRAQLVLSDDFGFERRYKCNDSNSFPVPKYDLERQILLNGTGVYTARLEMCK